MYFTFQTSRTSNEAVFINCIRPFVTTRFSLIAELKGRIAGHGLFIDAYIDSYGERFPSVAAGVLAVLPELRRQGIAGCLMEEGLRRCGQEGFSSVFALTEPFFYMKFGFEFASKFGLRYKWPEYDSQLMVRELVPGALSDFAGTVDFTPDLKELPRVPV